VGERYHFRLDEGGARADMVWEITAATPAEVRYTVTVFKNGVALGPPGASAWTPDPGQPSVPRGEIILREAAGRAWPCRVLSEGEVRTWVVVDPDGRPAFPPLLAQARGAAITTELVRVESP
jgi:hypothetical protein